ncbi:hypothetical protein CKM354_000725800 [Cercospora kikuchii]|uniref:UFSP1/2/DUB catalytic domain-containing protein n=1 Tax=Cercospora kikuchii TaxID=84275 RepID=A0A9P3CGQ6_9PEZI|nr:uncharacterized protein CKM354_000725800 [Cercospora kikuchii]GIZ44049.1 hypothetical protein CKM354_000725800 [Cercospora kikuchii]
MAVAEQHEIEVRRLGKRELGRHAFENRMPDRIADMIREETERNRARNVIPKLAQYLQQDPENKHACLCTTEVVQVHKLRNEGGHFCGYRNIQTLLSCLPASITCLGSSSSLDKCSILDIQEMIESAWDAGINSHGRIATGGIRGSRKHIGTPEAEALMLSLRIPCTGHVFEGRDAWHELLNFVEKYFAHAGRDAGSSLVCQTALMPLFFQRPGHSMTIIGLQKTRSGKRSLLVLDPAWQAPSAIVGSEDINAQSSWKRHRTLKMYRKSERYLKRFGGFEILEIRVPGKLDR